MADLTNLVWPSTVSTLTYEEHREKLSTLGDLDAGAIIKGDGTVDVTITGDNVYTISSSLTLKALTTTIDSTGKITLPTTMPCYGVFEVLYNDGTGYIELDLYSSTPLTISSDRLELVINDNNFYDVGGDSDILIKILTVS